MTPEEEISQLKQRVSDAQDNYDGALSDIDALLEVLIRRISGEATLESAAEWVRLNYPKAAQSIS